MSRKHSSFAAEYRQQMVGLVRGGWRPTELARDFECSASAIRNWVRQADRDEGLREDGLTTAEREELRGGSWYYKPGGLLSADRSRNEAGSRYYADGFRVARTLAR